MKLSTGFEQACCVLALLTSEDVKKPIANKTLTEAMGVSPTYTTKITRKLVVAKLITSATGVNGGFILGKPKNEITLYDVVKATDGDEVFFRSKGILERVFTNQEQKIQLGINLIDEALHEAQLKWEESLKKVSLDKIVKEVMAND